MDRRESLKTLFIGAAGSSLLLGCGLDDGTKVSELTDIREAELDYGRTEVEEARDEKLLQNTFYTPEEMQMIVILGDIIMPGEGEYKPASQVGVPEFIEFITKDLPSHKIPMRGGLRWLQNESYRRYEKKFTEIDEDKQLEIVEDIAYMDAAKPEFTQGAVFFNRIRNLVTTGYFTSKDGIEYLGYMGNRPNVWDGVPDDVLKKHGLQYDEKMLSQSIKPEERNEIEDWKNYQV